MAWLTFFYAAFIIIIVLFLPGGLILRATKLNLIESAAFAPILSSFFYAVVSTLLSILSITASWITLFIPFAFISLIVLVRHERLKTPDTGSRKAKHENKLFALILLLYALVGTIVFLWFYLLALPGPDLFIQKYDNTMHLNLIQSLYESGNYSTLNTSLYPDVREGAYYPALFHIMGALLMSFTGCSAAIAENAVLYVYTSIVLPFGVLALLNALSPKSLSVLIAGSFATVLFKGFPGNMLLWCLFPNILGYCLIPAALAQMYRILSRNRLENTAGIYSLLFIAFVIVCFFTHPNAAFSIAVFALSLIIWALWRADRYFDFDHLRNPVLRLFIIVLTVVSFIIFWVHVYELPFFNDTVSTTWKAFRSLSDAIIDAAMLAYRPISVAQPLLAFFVFFGIGVSLRNENYRWLSVSFVLISALYVYSSAIDNEIKHVLTGFWYTDVTRIGGIASICAMPLAALGISTLVDAICPRVEKWVVANAKGNNAHFALSFLICLLLSFTIILPGRFLPFLSGTTLVRGGYSHDEIMRTISDDIFCSSAFSALKRELKLLSNEESNSLTSQEIEFANAVAAIVPAGSRIANCPYDGSVWLYGVNGLSVCYRRTSYQCPYLDSSSNEPDDDIPKRLDEISTNTRVREKAIRAGISYVIQLDRDSDTDLRPPGYNPDNWIGIESINERTPGFELVLEEGNMRLFKVT